MAKIVRMPLMTDTMEEGVIASWMYKIGDKLPTAEPIAEVETDKATMELENYEEGYLLYAIEAGNSVPVNSLLYIVGEKGEDIQSLLNGGSTSSTPKVEEKKVEVAAVSTPASQKIDLSSVKAVAMRMPLMTDTMVEGVIANWLVNIGDKITSGTMVAEVETDKATMELECFEDGTVLYRAVEAGQGVAVNSIVMIIGEPGANYQLLLDAENNTSSLSPSEEQKPAPKADLPLASENQPQAATSAAAPTSSQVSGGRLKVSPLAKKLAKEKGIDLSMVSGSGEFGRIIKKDIETFVPKQAASNVASAATTQTTSVALGQESYTDEKVSQMRKAIGRRLSESKFTAPHFYLTISVDMGNAMEARKAMNTVEGAKISFNDLVVKAVALSLKKHPKVNASWRGDVIRYYNHIHIGVAVAVDEGLLVPVLRFADQKSLSQIGSEVKDFATKAKAKKLQPSDWEGNTFTISNLGMFGIDEFTAIVNPPDACILAVGAIQNVPVVKNGQVVPGHIMKVTLSCDHRVVDGAIGAPFLQTFKELLENPIKMLV